MVELGRERIPPLERYGVFVAEYDNRTKIVVGKTMLEYGVEQRAKRHRD